MRFQEIVLKSKKIKIGKYITSERNYYFVFGGSVFIFIQNININKRNLITIFSLFKPVRDITNHLLHIF